MRRRAAPIHHRRCSCIVAELEADLPTRRDELVDERIHKKCKKTHHAPDELIARIHLPRRPAPWRQYYRKVGTRRAQAIS